MVEAASSSLVTQTRKSLENIEFSRLFLYPVTQLFRGVLHRLPRSKGSREGFDTRLGGLEVVLLVAQP